LKAWLACRAEVQAGNARYWWQRLITCGSSKLRSNVTERAVMVNDETGYLQDNTLKYHTVNIYKDTHYLFLGISYGSQKQM
jgi:hypothetical protein